jgi:DNA-binding IclR family transcriptional regulator
MSSTPTSHAAASGTKTGRENVTAVTRALQILDAFRPDEECVTLTELARRVGMGKTTVLRTARTLERSRYLAQLDDSRWRLGPAAGWLGVRYQTSFDVSNVIDSTLRQLANVTGETTALFISEHDRRTCVARVDRPNLERLHIRVGEKLPLDRGASGRVLTAFAGEPGEYFDAIRRHGFYVSVSERDDTMASIAAPVFGSHRHLFGALCVSGPVDRLGRDQLMAHLPALLKSCETLSRGLASSSSAQYAAHASQWHP